MNKINTGSCAEVAPRVWNLKATQTLNYFTVLTLIQTVCFVPNNTEESAPTTTPP